MGENGYFCNKCGVQVPEDAKYCQECGAEITGSKNPYQNIDDGYNKQKIAKKSPAVIAITNIIIAGLGFAILREYTKAVLSFIIVLIAGVFFGLIGGILALIFVIAWTYDTTNKYNANLE